MEVIRKKTFYVFWLIYLCNTIAIGYINAMYKSFGQTFITDDHFLAVIGSLAAIFNAGGRVVWGYLMDKTSFRVSTLIFRAIYERCQTIFTCLNSLHLTLAELSIAQDLLYTIFPEHYIMTPLMCFITLSFRLTTSNAPIHVSMIISSF